MPIALALWESGLQQAQECRVRVQEQEAMAPGQEVAGREPVLAEGQQDRLAELAVIRVRLPAVADRYLDYDAFIVSYLDSFR